MLSADQNKQVTEIGPGTPCGDLMRRYWQPAALTEELDGPRPAKGIRLFGEDLVIFKDDRGRYGLVDRRCPHRGADLCYGRLEDGGLRCPFHGWLFDVTGACLEQPAEPADSNFYTKVRLASYPCQEVNGIIFAYMGPGEPPPLPNFDCFVAPDSHTFAFKGLWECNWLQAMEVGIDPSHASFLHRYLDDHDPEYGLQFGGKSGDSGMTQTQVLRDYDCPKINLEDTSFGLRLVTTRELNGDTMHVRVTNAVFPNLVIIPMTADMCISQWHVPIDDHTCWWYAIFTAFNEEVDKKAMRDQRLELYTLPDYRPRINKSNDYGYKPEEQRTQTYTGMGLDINVHDQWAVESPGPIFDRTREHLGTADKGIISFRKSLLAAMKDIGDGKAAPYMASEASVQNMTGPMTIDTAAPMESWQADWPHHDAEKRANSVWAGTPGI